MTHLRQKVQDIGKHILFKQQNQKLCVVTLVIWTQVEYSISTTHSSEKQCSESKETILDTHTDRHTHTHTGYILVTMGEPNTNNHEESSSVDTTVHPSTNGGPNSSQAWARRGLWTSHRKKRILLTCTDALQLGLWYKSHQQVGGEWKEQDHNRQRPKPAKHTVISI